jgi:hypothetical protein
MNREAKIVEKMMASVGKKVADSGDVPMYMNVNDYFESDSVPWKREQFAGAMNVIREAQGKIANDVSRLMISALRSSFLKRDIERLGLVLKD